MSSEVMGFENDMESSQEELLQDPEVSRRIAKRRRNITLIAGLLAMCAAVSVWHAPSITSTVKSKFFIGLAEDVDVSEVCEELPYVKLENVISNNLGKQGPGDKDGPEGIVYNATLHGVDADEKHFLKHFEIHVHTLASWDFNGTEEDNYDKNYVPAFQKGDYKNGIHGRFANIGVKPDESVKIRVNAYDPETKKDIPVDVLSISFFDLDTGPKAVEYIRVKGYKDYYVSNETEVNATHDDDGFTTFTATKEGTGDDNPKDPLILTEQQKNKAITVDFDKNTYFDFEIGATKGNTGRAFLFVFRPSLICALTKLGDGSTVGAQGKGAPIVPVLEKSGARKALLASSTFGFITAFLQFFL